MKKILVISDSHGILTNVKELFNRYPDVEDVIHLRDILGDYEEISQMCKGQFKAVRGNCDFGNNSLDLYEIVEVGDLRILATHGHECGVNYGLERLVNMAIINDCDIALYGHTHVPEVLEIEGVTVMNPGSISLPRQMNHRPSYGVIYLDENQVTCKVHYL